MKQSTKYTLSQTDLYKILVGAAVAVAGALLTYITTIVTQIDFGVYTPLVVATASVLVNAGRKFLEGK